MRVFGNVMVTLIIGSQILKAFCGGIWNLRKEKLYPDDFLMNTASNSSVESHVVNGRKCYGEASMSIYYLLNLDQPIWTRAKSGL